MHPDLQKYIDGELPLDALDAGLRGEAEAWDRLSDAALDLRAEPAPASLVARVMDALPAAAPRHAAWHGGLAWLLEPRPLQVRPVYGMLAAAALAALLLVPRAPQAPADAGGIEVPPPAAVVHASAEPIVYVRFSFTAPAAGSVALAGDFNDWQPEGLQLADPDGDGVWTGTFALQPGVHKYMFVIDGEHWETDPGAERHMDDGFGMRNALIAIAPPVRRAI